LLTAGKWQFDRNAHNALVANAFAPATAQKLLSLDPAKGVVLRLHDCNDLGKLLPREANPLLCRSCVICAVQELPNIHVGQRLNIVGSDCADHNVDLTTFADASKLLIGDSSDLPLQTLERLNDAYQYLRSHCQAGLRRTLVFCCGNVLSYICVLPPCPSADSEQQPH